MEKQNNLLKTARIQKSWTAKVVSEMVGVSQHTYARWEAGIQMPRHASLDTLCKVFSMSPAELGFASGSHVPTSIPKDTLFTADTESDEETPTLAQSLAMWQMGMASCWQWYMAGGQVELEELVPTYLARLTKHALAPSPEQLEAASLTSQVYQLLALLDLQKGDFVAAQNNGTQAVVYSQLSRDSNMYVAAQIRMAAIYSARKRTGAALSAYNDALRRVTSENDTISPILHSWIFAGLAEIQATMGREAEALQFLKLAVTVFPEHPQNDDCIAYAQCDRSMLYLYQGLVFLRLGQPRLAWGAFSQVDDLRPAPPERVRAEFLRYRAYTSFVLGNMIQSCIYMEAAAKATQAIQSELLFSEVYTLYEHLLAVWGQESRVRDLAMLFQK